LELQQRLIAEGKRVPVVFISAHDDPHSQMAAMAAGAVDFLRKPFEEQALLDVLATALAQ
jgi:FixJ family two-component response regulator